MNNHHIIDSAIFEITYDNNALNYSDEFSLDEFVKSDIFPVLEEIFNEVNKSVDIIRIDKLEIDLGDILLSDYKAEAPKLVRDKTTSKLNEICKEFKNNSKVSCALTDTKKGDQEELFYFLLHGQIPWYSRLGNYDDIDKLLNRVIGHSSDRLMSFLHNNSSIESIADRMSKQFSKHSLMRVIQLFYLSSINEIEETISMLNQHIKSDHGTNSKYGISSQSIELTVFENILVECVKCPDREPSIKDLMSSMFERIKTDYSLAKSNASGEYIDLTKPNEFEETESRLVSLLLNGDKGSLVACWSALYKENPKFLVKTLRQYGLKINVRKNLVNSLSTRALCEILVLVLPIDSDHDFVKSIVLNDQLFQCNTSDNSTGSLNFKTMLWEISLGYLFSVNDRNLNKATFLSCLINHVSSYLSMQESKLLTTIQTNARTLSQPDRFSTQLIKALSAVESNLGNDLVQGELKVSDNTGVYACYERLKNVITNAYKYKQTNESLIYKDITFLNKYAPWLLIKLSRDLRYGDKSWMYVVELFSAALLFYLVKIIMLLRSHTKSEYYDDFINSIEQSADGSNEKKHIYLSVLKCLIKDELIDLDVINKSLPKDVQSDKLSSVEQNVAVASEQNIEMMVSHLPIGKTLSMLSGYLLERAPFSDLSSIDVASLFDRLSIEEPVQLMALIKSYHKGSDSIKILAERMPEICHFNYLRLSGVSGYNNLLQTAELIDTACYDTGMLLSNKKFSTLKWQSIYDYLITTGYFYNQNDFITTYINALQSHSDTDHQEFITKLREQLLLNSLSSTHELTQGIINLLRPEEQLVDTIVKSSAVNDSPLNKNSTDDKALDESIYIENAGMVLAAVYLPGLFKQLELTDASKFKNPDLAERAVHILQFIVTEQVSSPEFQLVLNKILCGLEISVPISQRIELSAGEIDLIESLMLSMVKHWKALGNTSISGLRQSFMQRHGRLQMKKDNWLLVIESKSYDMLLDSIPWSYSTIKLPWMDRLIYVEWR